MTQGIYTVRENTRLTDWVWRMVLEGDTSALTKPGQFVNLKLDGFFLRRPISVCDYDAKTVTILYKTVGKGTEAMTRLEENAKVDMLCGLGNGFSTELSGDAPLLIGGGVGIPPMYRLCKNLLAQGKKVQVILGFRTAAEIFYEEEFKALGAEVYVTTEDGSHGTKGFVTDVLKNLSYSYFYTCGPMPMFRAIEATATTSG